MTAPSADWRRRRLLLDLAGRVFKNVPAPLNLVIPPHKYLSDSRLLIGADRENT